LYDYRAAEIQFMLSHCSSRFTLCALARPRRIHRHRSNECDCETQRYGRGPTIAICVGSLWGETAVIQKCVHAASAKGITVISRNGYINRDPPQASADCAHLQRRRHERVFTHVLHLVKLARPLQRP